MKASVLFTKNTIHLTTQKDPVCEFLLYTAKIPVALLEFFRRPKAVLPAYDGISVICVSIPVEPVESLRERILMAIPDIPNTQEDEEGGEQASDGTGTPPAE